MIIDKIITEGVPFRCDKCGTLFVWKPDEEGTGFCSLYDKQKTCQERDCMHFLLQDYNTCPICKNRHNTAISPIRYKLLRAFKKLWE